MENSNDFGKIPSTNILFFNWLKLQLFIVLFIISELNVLWAELCMLLLPNSCVDVLTPAHQNVTYLEIIFKEETMLQWKDEGKP